MAGEYRQIIKNSNTSKEIKDLFEKQTLHIAFANSVVGDVKSTNELDNELIKIFKADLSSKSQSYLEGIKTGRLKVVYTFNGKTFKLGKEIYKNNGELYFKS